MMNVLPRAVAAHKPMSVLARTSRRDLWTLALAGSPIDSTELADAFQDQAIQGPLDFRTRPLIRDSLDALSHHWGEQRLSAWLNASPAAAALEQIRRAGDLGPPGFPSLKLRIMETTRPETVLQFLRELSLHVHRPARLEIGGSIALILAATLS